MNELQSRLDFSVDAARQAGDITLRYFGKLSAQQRQDKADGSPVTIADRESETLLRELITARYPDDAILGEEFEDKHGTSGYRWVIDPIDGTISFVQGVPLYGTMLACMHHDTPIVGVIHMPVLNETIYAAQGLGCWQRCADAAPSPAAMSSTETPSDAIINTTSMSYFTTPQLRALYDRLDASCRCSRGWSDCYAWVLLATGRVDAVIEPDLKLWDFAAAIPIIRESGGIWGDLGGRTSLETTQILAANPTLHPRLLEICGTMLEQGEGVTDQKTF